jgi:hypothetical protein
MDHFESSLSDPVGNSIGVQIVSKIDCRQRVGDSCLAADTTRTGFLDTTIVRSVPGIVSCTKE